MTEPKKSPANVFRRHPVLTFTLLLLLTWSWFYPGWRQEMTRRPLDVPISVSPPGEIRESIHVPLNETYQLLLGFDASGRDTFQWMELLGDRHEGSIKKGIPIKVQWEFYEKSKQALIKSEVINTFHIGAWSREYVFRRIGYIKVPPGEYEVAVKLLQEVPEIKNPRARVVMKLSAGKDTALTPELNWIMWVSIFAIEPLMWWIEALLTLILAIKMLRGT